MRRTLFLLCTVIFVGNVQGIAEESDTLRKGRIILAGEADYQTYRHYTPETRGKKLTLQIGGLYFLSTHAATGGYLESDTYFGGRIHGDITPGIRFRYYWPTLFFMEGSFRIPWNLDDGNSLDSYGFKHSSWSAEIGTDIFINRFLAMEPHLQVRHPDINKSFFTHHTVQAGARLLIFVK